MECELLLLKDEERIKISTELFKWNKNSGLLDLFFTESKDCSFLKGIRTTTTTNCSLVIKDGKNILEEIPNFSCVVYNVGFDTVSFTEVGKIVYYVNIKLLG